MKVDVCFILEATVICILAVCVVVPPVEGQSATGSRSEGVLPLSQPGGAGPSSVNKGGSTGASVQPPTSPNLLSKSNDSVPVASPSTRPITTHLADSTNCTSGNGTECNTNTSFGARLLQNKGMLQRAVYVLIGVTVVILIYFGLRTWSTRKRKSKAKKYGLITTPANDLEMAPLDADDDDEDMTVFEVNGLHK